jgi:hypothetical protein
MIPRITITGKAVITSGRACHTSRLSPTPAEPMRTVPIQRPSVPSPRQDERARRHRRARQQTARDLRPNPPCLNALATDIMRLAVAPRIKDAQPENIYRSATNCLGD